jgi:MoaA/NifB/PqqE/SkfB family radical SAM enzyme
MRIARVYTNETCNQNCAFCNTRRPTETRAFVERSAVEARIAKADASTIVLTGGEPTMRRDLPELVAFARRTAEEVVLETNAALLDRTRAEALREAGLDVARVHLPAWGDALDAITRDVGGFSRTERGLAALAAVGIRLEASAPVVTENRDSLPTLPRALAESGHAFEKLHLSVPTEAPDPHTLLSLSEAASVVERTESAARRVGLPCTLDANALVPPCFFERTARVAHLFTLTSGGASRPGYTQVRACTGCTVSDRCPGIPDAALAREPSLAVSPIVEDRLRRRLSIISSVDEQIAREVVQDDRYIDGSTGEPTTIPARIVRINFACNQACHFCFVSTHLPPAEASVIEDAILDISRRGGALVLSGGEPTLNPRLLDYVRLGKKEGARVVELQTNATRLDDAALVQSLVSEGVDVFFVSLHGSTPEISDAITNAPGTFEATARGLDVLNERAPRLKINFVFCGRNWQDFPDWIDLVGARWPSATATVSFVAPSTDVVPRTEEMIPRYSLILPSLAEGLARAVRHGLTVDGFESMCGIPLCLVPTELASLATLDEIPPDFDRGEFVETDACRRCDLLGKCFGLRRGYAELHGDAELDPVRMPG